MLGPLTHLLTTYLLTSNQYYQQALFSEAVEVHPHLRSARGQLRRIENLLGQGKPH